MSVNLSPVGGAGAQFCDNNGNPLNGGKLYTYSAGTTTPVATYTSSAGATFHPNPIVLNAGGRVPDSGEIWLSDNISYKFVLKTSADVLIATWDNINGINSNFVNYTVQEEVITATAGQTVFDLSTITYAPATNSLSVFVDGVNQIITEAYVETDANTVTFVSGLHVGAQVKFTTAVPATGTATNAAVVTYDPAGTGAVPTTVQAKLRESVSVKDFGAVGDGVTDDTAAIQAANATAGFYVLPIGSYYTATGDSTNSKLAAFGVGGEITTDQKTTLLSGSPQTDSQKLEAEYSSIVNLGAEQPYFGGAGVDNNHGVFKLSGKAPMLAFNYGNVDIVGGFGYGPNTVSERSSKGSVFLGNRFVFYTMGYENFSGYTSCVGNTMVGDGAPSGGTKTASHAYRQVGYVTSGISPNHGSVSAANVGMNSNTLLSMQKTTRFHNHVGLHGTNHNEAIQFPQDYSSDDDVQRYNIVSTTVKDGQRAVFIQGAEYNIFEINTFNNSAQAIEIKAPTGGFGSGKGNWFRGIIHTCGTGADRAVLIDSSAIDTRFDLQIINSTTFGIVINANGAFGTLFVDGAGTGVRINSNNCNLTIVTKNCSSNDIVIAGNNNTLNVQCAGNISCTGTGNTVSGTVGGTITGRYGNNFQNVFGEFAQFGTTVTTDGSGDFVLTHNLGSTYLDVNANVVTNFSSGFVGQIVPVDITTTTVTLRVFDMLGTAQAARTLIYRAFISKYRD